MIARDSNADLEHADREPPTEPDLALLSRQQVYPQWAIFCPELQLLIDLDLVEVTSRPATNRSGAYVRLTESGEALACARDPKRVPYVPSPAVRRMREMRREAETIEAAMKAGK